MENEEAKQLAEELIDLIKKFRPRDKLIDAMANAIKEFVEKPRKRVLGIDDLMSQIARNPHVKIMETKDVPGESQD